MSDATPEKTPKATVTFKRAADYRTYAATDLWGGPTPDGQKVLFHLVIDRMAIPSYQTFMMNEEGQIKLDQPLEIVRASEIEKELLCGILITPTEAIKWGEWLVRRGKELLEKKGE